MSRVAFLGFRGFSDSQNVPGSVMELDLEIQSVTCSEIRVEVCSAPSLANKWE